MLEDSKNAESSISYSNQPIKESQPKQLKTAHPDNAVEIIPAAYGQSAKFSVSDSIQPDTTMHQSGRQPERPAYLKDCVEN